MQCVDAIYGTKFTTKKFNDKGPSMTPQDAERFEHHFNHWATSDIQMRTKNGDFGDGTQHTFMTDLLVWREDIIAAVKAAVEQPKK